MTKEIFLRTTHPKLVPSLKEIGKLISQDHKVTFIEDFDLTSQFTHIKKRILSISKEITGFDYFKISRVFNTDGAHIGWFIPEFSSGLIHFDSVTPMRSGEGLCIVDTDIATGSTKKVMSRLFPGADFYAPLSLNPDQDLIDIEDLIYPLSLVAQGNKLIEASYMLSPQFFEARTSLSQTYFEKIKAILPKS